MMPQGKKLLAVVLALALLVGPVQGASAALFGRDGQADPSSITPPRLSYSDGEVSFWRPGAQDWAPAQINTPLVPGDELYAGERSHLELQVGSRAYVRASGDTQVGVVNQDPDFLQLKVTDGTVSVDLRSLDSGSVVEVDTPQAALTIERPGYYRVDVSQDRTSFITRRGGRATVTPAGGQAVTLAASEEMVLDGVTTPTIQSYVAPQLDSWDRWNYARSEHLLDAVSARYVPPGVYGTEALDQYGNWREVATYGPVWVPQAVAPDWVPYSTGRWIADPTYGWTWVDTAPWGWAPYHYGRWVFVDGFWAWAPGPMVRRAVYAPALVAFFGGPGVRVAVGSPFVSWVALGWGEPVVPWWGRSSFVGRPWWGGWGGPRVVNNVVINRTTEVNVTNINVYRNVTVHNAVVAVNQEQFGRRAVHEARVPQVDVQRLEPVRGALRVAPTAASYVAASGPARRPPEAALKRSVVATRPMPNRKDAARGENRAASPAANTGAPVVSAPAPQIVPAPKRAEAGPAPVRPTFGASPNERPRPAQPPTPDMAQPSQVPPAVPQQADRQGRQDRRTDATPPAQPARTPAQPLPAPPAPVPPAPAPPSDRQTGRQERQVQDRRTDATPPAQPARTPAQPLPAQPAPGQPAPVPPAPAPPSDRQTGRQERQVQERRTDAPPPAQPARTSAQPAPAPPAPAQPVERQTGRQERQVQERRTDATPPAQPARTPAQPPPAQPAPVPPAARAPAQPQPASQQRVEPAPPSPRPLPGEPANRLYPGRTENKQPRAEEHARNAAPQQPGAAAGPSRGPGQRQG